MKKLLFTLLATCALTTAKADEGMWTLYNLPNAVYETMKQENYELPYGALYQGDDAIKNCVVNFGGYCSGVVVSPDGLVFTNHHCGFEAIRSHSTVEHDYTLRALEEGLEAFAGCAVIISHDRWFLDRICTHILAFEGEGRVFYFEGNYSEYEVNKAQRLGLEEPKRIRYRKLMED